MILPEQASFMKFFLSLRYWLGTTAKNVKAPWLSLNKAVGVALGE